MSWLAYNVPLGALLLQTHCIVNLATCLLAACWEVQRSSSNACETVPHLLKLEYVVSTCCAFSSVRDLVVLLLS